MTDWRKYFFPLASSPLFCLSFILILYTDLEKRCSISRLDIPNYVYFKDYKLVVYMFRVENIIAKFCVRIRTTVRQLVNLSRYHKGFFKKNPIYSEVLYVKFHQHFSLTLWNFKLSFSHTLNVEIPLFFVSSSHKIKISGDWLKVTTWAEHFCYPPSKGASFDLSKFRLEGGLTRWVESHLCFALAVTPPSKINLYYTDDHEMCFNVICNLCFILNCE